MKSLFRLTTYLAPYRRRMLLSLLVLLLLTAIDMTVPAIIQQVIDRGLEARQLSILIIAAGAIVGLGLLRAGLAFIQGFNIGWVSHKVAYDVRNQLYNHIQNLPFGYHDHIQSGQLISRCIEDVRAIQNFVSSGVLDLVRTALLMVGITIVLFITNPYLAAISLIPMIPMIIITNYFGQTMGRLFLEVDNSLGDLNSRLQENVTGVQVVRAFARERYETARFDRINRIVFRARIKVMAEWAKIMPTTMFLVSLGTILILWFGGPLVIAGKMSLGELVAFNSYVLLLALPAQQLGWLVNAAGEASAGVQRTMEILDHVPEIQSPSKAIQLDTLRGEVDFEDVTFNYTSDGDEALDQVNLKVRPNQVIALIGPTGSGKTSLVNLVPRFYDVSKGAVKVDGKDVRKVDLVTLRRQIGIVLQSSLLFSATIRENIAYGRPAASLEEVVAAAKAAQAHDFISAMPEGYDTVVGERGVTLSGGQRQRVAIARALLLDPRILILDDSTSSVDTQTEHQIQAALSRLMEGRTTFVIAQRLSSVQRADLILVMDHGRIIERGTHHDLLKKDGLYRQIYDLQLRDQEEFREQLDLLEQAGIEPMEHTKEQEREH